MNYPSVLLNETIRGGLLMGFNKTNHENVYMYWYKIHVKKKTTYVLF